MGRGLRQRKCWQCLTGVNSNFLIDSLLNILKLLNFINKIVGVGLYYVQVLCEGMNTASLFFFVFFKRKLWLVF